MGRTLRVTPIDQIIPNRPVKPVRGRAARLAAYRAQREERAVTAPPEPAERWVPPYPGYVSPQSMFPEWDWAGRPEGPPLDDPLVKAFTDLQWKAFLKNAKR